MLNPSKRDDRLFTTHQAAEYLGLSPKTLETWRCRGDRPQPRSIKLGAKAIRYRQSDLDAFILAGLQGEGDE